jgi:hypothetical protein
MLLSLQYSLGCTRDPIGRELLRLRSFKQRARATHGARTRADRSSTRLLLGRMRADRFVCLDLNCDACGRCGALDWAAEPPVWGFEPRHACAPIMPVGAAGLWIGLLEPLGHPGTFDQDMIGQFDQDLTAAGGLCGGRQEPLRGPATRRPRAPHRAQVAPGPIV